MVFIFTYCTYRRVNVGLLIDIECRWVGGGGYIIACTNDVAMVTINRWSSQVDCTTNTHSSIIDCLLQHINTSTSLTSFELSGRLKLFLTICILINEDGVLSAMGLTIFRKVVLLYHICAV